MRKVSYKDQQKNKRLDSFQKKGEEDDKTGGC